MPVIGTVTSPVVLDTRDAEGVVQERGKAHVLLTNKRVPLLRQLAYLLFFHPLEAMQERAWRLRDKLRGQNAIGMMSAVPENHAAAILAWIVDVLRLHRCSDVLTGMLRLVV